MDRIIHPNRWFIWTIVAIVAVGALVFGYLEWSKGSIDVENVDIDVLT